MTETLVRSLIRLIVTVAIIGAVYLFLVKPILDTTNETINRAFEGGQNITDQIQESLEQSGIDDFDIDLDSQKQAQKLLNCIQRARQDVERIKRCNERFG